VNQKKETITVLIPVESHVRKYLEHNYFLKGMLVVTTNDIVGDYLLSICEQKSKDYKPLKLDKSFCIEVALTFHRETYLKSYLSERSIKKFNLHIEKLMKFELQSNVKMIKSFANVETKRIINEFIEKYQLGNTKFNYEMLKKYLQRINAQVESLDIAC
jgi:hypothetical protein